MLENSVDVIAIQETHTKDAADLNMRGNVHGYTLAGAINDEQYGVATYIRSQLKDFKVVYEDRTADIYVLAIELAGIIIVNIYKPPGVTWPNPPVPSFSHPVLYVGDFNSHSHMWGYENDDINGTIINNWIEINNLHLLYNAKDLGTFRSGRWQKDYCPDLCIMSDSINRAQRRVLKSFPHSQHRPVIIQYGIEIPLVSSVPLPRWNFQLAKWDMFAECLDYTVQWIPPIPANYERFVNAIKASARQYIPRGFRKEYIPAWSKECDELYSQYQVSHSAATADDLLKTLNISRREKWHRTTAELDFTHSSRKAWNLVRKLGTDPNLKCRSSCVSSNDVASRLLLVSKAKIDKEHARTVKKELRTIRSHLVPDVRYSKDFSIDELNVALNTLKTNKASGIDGVFPEFLKAVGLRTKQWLLDFFNEILRTGKLPKLFKVTKVIAVLKPGKEGTDASHYRPISLLSMTYKLLEKLILNRIQETIDTIIPTEQGGFRKNRSCCDQILTMTTLIESGFQRGLKSAAAFVDLTAAYDTVWREGLLFKFAKIIPCQKLMFLLNNMLCNRRFRVFLNGKASRWRMLNNGLPQGSVLAPILFNLYIHDIPDTISRKIQYADDLALVYQSKSFENCENVLTNDLSTLSSYFHKWRLQPNPNKTEVSAFHLHNMEAQKKLQVTLDGVEVNHNLFPKYLGITLDRSLSFLQHCSNISKKLGSRLNLLHKLAGSSWGADACSLRTASLALVYSVGEFCAPVWENSIHSTKIDVKLNEAMRIISCTVRSTPLQWLPVLSNIAPPDIRRKEAKAQIFRKTEKHKNSLLYDVLQDPPKTRLKSRKPPWADMESSKTFTVADKWRERWVEHPPRNGHLVKDPTRKVEGFHLPRPVWSSLNRFRTGHGRCGYLKHKWGFCESASCDCGAIEQTMEHLVESCPSRAFPGGLLALHQVTPEAVTWLSNLDIVV